MEAGDSKFEAPRERKRDSRERPSPTSSHHLQASSIISDPSRVAKATKGEPPICRGQGVVNAQERVLRKWSPTRKRAPEKRSTMARKNVRATFPVGDPRKEEEGRGTGHIIEAGGRRGELSIARNNDDCSLAPDKQGFNACIGSRCRGQRVALLRSRSVHEWRPLAWSPASPRQID
ncbi:hypothetical protein KM043_011226 [Ampulex compressa]|nr:hypothetical protein KM043_011226 [Ampulex compressa]